MTIWNEIYWAIILLLTVLIFVCNKTNVKFFTFRWQKRLVNYQISKITMWTFVLLLISFFGINFITKKNVVIVFTTITNSFFSDSLMNSIKLIFIITLIIITSNTKKAFLFTKINSANFSLLLIFVGLFLITLLHTYNLISFFIVLLGASIILYSLIGIDKYNHSSREAVSKYFLLSAVTSGFFSFSIVNFLSIFKTTNFNSINIYVSLWQIVSNNTKINSILFCSLLFFCMALFFKLSAFPGHLWVVDIYQGSSNSTMSIFLLPTKISVFFSSIRIFSWVFDALKSIWGVVFWISSILSMIWGCIGAIVELHFKKFLAYASVNQIGFFFIGISCLTFLGNISTYLYIYIYIFTNIILFGIYLNATETLTKKPILYVNNLNSFYGTNFIFTILITITLFSMAGIPPFSGFFTKFFLFEKAFQANYFSLVLIGMATSLVSTFYYLNILNKMWFFTTTISKKTYVEQIDGVSNFFVFFSCILVMLFPVNNLIYTFLCVNNSFFII